MVTKAAVTKHPRAYRVRRFQSGIDWDAWTNTYHPTIEAARKAAEGYLRGTAERYRFRSYTGSNGRSVAIGERREFRGYASYDTIEKVKRGANGDLITEAPLVGE